MKLLKKGLMALAVLLSLPEDYKDLGYIVTAKYGKWGSSSEKEKQVMDWKPLSQGIDAVFRIPAADKESLLELVVSISLCFNGYISWSASSHDFFLAYGGEKYSEIDTDAGEDSGENGWVVPAAVAGGLAVGGLALKGRKKNVAAKKSTYEMRIRKDFGDTLTPGGGPQKVFARIVRIPQGGTASTDSVLTSKISITGDGYLNVSGQNLAGEYMSASVEAPHKDNIPSEAVVNFRLASGGGAFTNRMHFKVTRSEIIFFQENLTLPACSDEVWRLPFAVRGVSKIASVEACSSCLNAFDVKIDPAEKDCLFYAVIKEKKKDRKEAGTWEQLSLGIKVSSGASEISDSLPLYRFHLGLKLGIGYTLPCYLQTSETGKTEVAIILATLVYYDWDPETNDIVTVFPVPKAFNVSSKGGRKLSRRRFSLLRSLCGRM